jgi:hypothetical protein
MDKDMALGMIGQLSEDGDVLVPCYTYKYQERDNPGDHT